MNRLSRHFKLPAITLLVMVSACGSQEQPRDTGDDLTKEALLAASCSGCHQAGNSSIPDYAELSRSDFSLALSNYKNDTKGNTVMHRIMRGYSDADIALLAEYLGAENE